MENIAKVVQYNKDGKEHKIVIINVPHEFIQDLKAETSLDWRESLGKILINEIEIAYLEFKRNDNENN